MSDPNYLPLARCYKQLNSSVGRFGTSTLVADTQALASGSGVNDSQFTSTETQLTALLTQRDPLATTMKSELSAAAFSATPLPASASADLGNCNGLLETADVLGGITPPGTVPETPLAIMLPLAGLAVGLGGVLVVRHRRRRVASA
jgi:hypothetical protein